MTPLNAAKWEPFLSKKSLQIRKTLKVRFYKAVEREFDEAVQYYESQLPGRGERYRQAVKEALEPA